MTQQQQLELLNSIMPEIVSTKNPEGVMLKCAKEHNLAPAQLEKLAQCFNTTKTLVGLEKQANRGDSFSIVDVPNLVSGYVTYDPEKTISSESKSVHKQVNKLMKYASEDDLDGWGACLTALGLQKAASNESLFETHGTLPSLEEVLADAMHNQGGKVELADNNTTAAHKQVSFGAPEFDIMHKKASRGAAVTNYQAVSTELRHAQEDLDQIEYEVRCKLQEKCAAVRLKFTPDEGRWKEAVEDLVDICGEKSASVINLIEDYFNATNFKFEPADLTKRAFLRPRTRDRHEMLAIAEEMAALIEIHKEAAAAAGTGKKSKKSKKSKKKIPGRPDWASYKTAVNPYPPEPEPDPAPEPEPKELPPDAPEDLPDPIPDPPRDTPPDPDDDPDPDPEPKDTPPDPEDHTDPDPDPRDTPPDPDDDHADPEPKRQTPGKPGKTMLPMTTVGTSLLGMAARAVESAPEGVMAFAEGLRNPLFKGTGLKTLDPLKGLNDTIKLWSPDSSLRQKTIDRAGEVAKQQTAIQSLMMSDPIIADADQSTVKDIYKTIASLSPTLASDPRMLAPIMKEALQYDSVPIQMLKDIVAFENERLKADKQGIELDSMKY